MQFTFGFKNKFN